jgi:hypothetical protein
MTHKDLANGLYAAACVPLIAHEKTFGALWVGRERPFGEAEIHLLTAIVDITANAIHRAESSAQTDLPCTASRPCTKSGAIAPASTAPHSRVSESNHR